MSTKESYEKEGFHDQSLLHSSMIRPRLFDELVKCDEEGILKDVRKAVEGAE
jgi:hypothetical protein